MKAGSSGFLRDCCSDECEAEAEGVWEMHFKRRVKMKDECLVCICKWELIFEVVCL